MTIFLELTWLFRAKTHHRTEFIPEGGISQESAQILGCTVSHALSACDGSSVPR